MSDQRVLVVFANQAGSTAGIAATIAGVLRRSGLDAECRVASEVADLTPYGAVVLGSGVFVPRRRTDGGGFLARHAAALRGRALWLFSAGPIGRGRCDGGTPAVSAEDCSVVAVARAVGARGAAVFGPIGLSSDGDPIEELGPANVQRIRAWAAEIAAQLRSGAPGPRQPGPPVIRGLRPRPVRAGDVTAESRPGAVTT
jgi:menaquinone-dependent protoporphyrinogen oxidase